MSLKSRRKFGFVDGTIKKPTTQFDSENWEVVHCTLVQWIRNTIDSDILESISYVDDASVLWAELEAQFAVVDGTKIHSLKTQLHNCKTDERYIGQAAIKRLDNERLHQFFMGLDTTLYGNIRSQQFQLEPLPTLNHAYNLVLQEERLRSESVPDVSKVSVFAMCSANSTVDWRALRDKERATRRPLFCSHCETHGHELATCFFKSNRFPDWWGDMPRTLADYRRYMTNGSGSSRDNTATGTADRDKDNTVHANAVMGPTAQSLLTSDRLSGMFNWILDTGASNHVTGFLSCLEDRQTILGMPVCLPSGQQVVATMTGSDRSLRTTIGAGELRDGLYWICAGTRTVAVNSVTQQGTFDLWHRRLGHPSDKVVKIIPPLSGFNRTKDLVCDICHYAKM
ncbi:uncharacterized protein LOC141631800 [Silene latifolia]|uniref:uncharacterized protein LOC141631800 n=1 Tax=Silene latifolia TaxID=37657 RepID=UPI003D76BE17